MPLQCFSDRLQLLSQHASLCLAILALVEAPAAMLAAQNDVRVEPASYRLALALLDAGDTASAVDRLRDVVEEVPDFGPALLRLGSILSSQAHEIERQYDQRMEAERLLERAHRLMGSDPEVLLEYGLLLRKQHVRVDAKRVLDRAWKAAEEKGESISRDNRARMHFELGRIYQAWWEDWDGLVMVPPTAERISCSGIAWGGGPDQASPVLCPEAWAEQNEQAVPLAGLKSEERARMMEHFLLALEADPGHVDAAVAALSYLAEGGEWKRYDQIAHELLRQSPRDPRTNLFVGLGLHNRGRDDEAEAAFRRAVELLPSDQRRVFEDVGVLLPRNERRRYEAADRLERADFNRMVFTAKDPLFLTDANERELEHYARLAWAELRFSAPASGLRGWESDRGNIWVRYGRPWRSAMCCYGLPVRTITWSYGPRGPLFQFDKRLTYRRARFEVKSFVVAEALEKESPEAYTPVTVTAVHSIPHQLARFRGSGADLTRVEIYAAPPLDSLGADSGTRLETGIFTFLLDYTPVWQRKNTTELTERGVGLTYVFEVLPGAYRYALEARRAGPDSLPRPVGRARTTVETEVFPAGRLSISDLLLAADTVRPRNSAQARRDDLVIVPLRGTTVPADQPIHLYFEVYGLAADSAGVGAFRAELAVEDSTKRSFGARLIRAGRNVLGLGEDQDATVSWERQAEIVDDMVPEYISIEVPGLEAGEYAVRVRLIDLATGQEAERVRRVSVVPEEAGGR
ncbi:MAG: GWxTD domain-containing protein [Gemmatimonadota bacterium]